MTIRYFTNADETIAGAQREAERMREVGALPLLSTPVRNCACGAYCTDDTCTLQELGETA